jgi:hypothetical protein
MKAIVMDKLKISIKLEARRAKRKHKLEILPLKDKTKLKSTQKLNSVN